MFQEYGPSLEYGNIAGVLMLSSHEAAFVALKDNQVAIPEPEFGKFCHRGTFDRKTAIPMCSVSAVPCEEFAFLFFLT